MAWPEEPPAGDWIETTANADGNGSVTTTPVAVDGPRLLTVMVKVTLLVTRVEVGDAVWVRARSAAGVTVVKTTAELFAGVGSIRAEVTPAVLVMVPATRGVTVMVMVAVALLARLAMVQVRIPLFVATVPWGLLAETYVAPAGKVSVTTRPVAVDTPRLVKARV